MAAQSGLGFSGIVAIQIPDDGAPGTVLTKITADNYDYDWLPGGGGGGSTIIIEDEGIVVGVPADTLNFIGAGVTAAGAGTTKTITIADQVVTSLTLTGLFGTILNLFQTNGASPISIDLAAALGLSSLQTLYDVAPATPQIIINAVPEALTIQASVAGEVFSVHDIAGNEILTVRANPDTVTVEGAFTIRDAFINGAAPISLVLDDTFTTGGGFNGGGISSTGTVTYDNSFFIWALLSETKVYQGAAAPGFAAFTLFNALPRIVNSGNFNLTQALVLNVGVTHERATAGTSTTVQVAGVSFSAQARASIAGAAMTYTTGMQGLRFSPTFSTVAGSAINYGTLIALQCVNPAQAIFQPSAGVESMTAYIGVDVQAIPFGGNVTKRGFRCGLTAASNALMIENTGGASSNFANGHIYFNDNRGVAFGGIGTALYDAWIRWVGAGNVLGINFITSGDDLEFSSPSANRFLISSNDDSANEVNFNFSRFSFGAQTGANGNQVGAFVTPARTITVGGEWADFLLTQGNQLTVNGQVMSRITAWVINGISYAASTGSVGEADTLTVGGFVTSAPGVTVTTRQSLNVIGGRSRFKSVMQYDPINPAALGAADNDDWAGLLTGSANNGMRHWARVSGNATTSHITGIDATSVQDGDTFEITNVSANAFDFNHQDTASVAANRIISPTGAAYLLGADETVLIRYDATTARWRLLAGTGA